MQRLCKCAFCGSHKITTHTIEEWDKKPVTLFECEKCGSVTYFAYLASGEELSGEEAIKRWNRRAIEL